MRRPVLIAALTLAACGGADPSRPGPSLPVLEDWLDAARLTRTDDAPTVEAELLRLDSGRAWIRVELAGASGVREGDGAVVLERFALPFEADFPVRLGSPPASVETADGERFTIGAARVSDALANIPAWIEGATLMRTTESAADVPPDFRLTYPVAASAAYAAGLLPDAEANEVLWTRVGDEVRRRSALRLDPGIRLELPPLSGARLVCRAPEEDRAVEGFDSSVDGWLIADLSEPRTLSVPDGPVHLIEPELVAEGSTSSRPNVLVLVLDTLRADRLGPWRSEASLTPTLDALLLDSTVWTRAWSNAPWTLPSISTLLTGLQAAEHGAYHGTAALREGPATLAEAFAGAGYRTAAFTDAGYFQATFGLDRGFQHFDASTTGIRAAEGELMEWLTDRRERPFFAVLHTYHVHEPYEPRDPRAAEILAPFSEEERELIQRPSLGLEQLEPGVPFTIPAAMTDAMRALYDLEVRELDAELAALCDRLRAADLWDDTLIAIVADHGEEFGERGLAGHGDTLFPEQLHVPLSIRVPGASPRTVDTPVSTVDFASTLLASAGVDPQVSGVPGTDLRTSASPSPTFAWRQPDGERAALRAVRSGGSLYVDGEFRYPRALEASGLWNLDADPQARANLLGSTPDLERLEALRSLLEQHPEPPPFDEGQIDPALQAQLEALGYH